MKKGMTRLLALLLALCLLSGCGAKESRETEPTQPTQPTEPISLQEPMPHAQLQEALARAEYAMLAAAIAAEGRLKAMEGFVEYPVYVGDIDGDNQLELARGGMAMFFDIDADRDFRYEYTQNVAVFYVDEEGTFYKGSHMGDGWPEPMSEGYYHCYDYFYNSFSAWKDGQWQCVLRSNGESVREAWDNPDGFDLRYGEYLEYRAEYEVDGQIATEEEYNSRCDKLTKITTKPSDYTVNIYDAIYADSLLAALESRFGNDFGANAIRQDIDDDGQLETVLAVPQLFAPYKAANSRHTDELWHIENPLEGCIDTSRSQTGILVADIEGDKLTLSAYCALTDVELYKGMTVAYRDNCLWLDSIAIYAPAQFQTLESLTEADRTGVYNGLVNFLATGGYTQAVLKRVDISDAPGSELLCLCQKDGIWFVLVIIFQNGTPSTINRISLQNSAVYLTEVDGKQAILTYNQNVYTSQNGNTHTNYYFSVYRYDQNGEYFHIAGESVGYGDDDKDATRVAEFFQTLNAYLVKIIVIADPFQLTGNQWPDQEELDHGTAPQDPEPEQAEEYVMGFVQIQDPSSWLNLREGPGTEYACILMDENNPDSFVRQALGSPVTVLETIETGDAENPVWLKIRITYADKVIEGYSSKTYIRLAE